MSSTHFPRTVAFAAALALGATITAGGSAFAADTAVSFGSSRPAATDVAGASKDVFTLPVVTGVANYIVKFTGGTNDGRTVVYAPSTAKIATLGATKVDITPVAKAGYTIASADAAQALSFDATPTTVTVATAPTAVDNPGRANDKISITPVANVTWTVNGKAVAVTGTKPVLVPVPVADYKADNTGAAVTVEAKPVSVDYAVTSTTNLTFKDKVEIKAADIAAAVKGVDAGGVSKDAVEISYLAGVNWKVNGRAVAVPAPSTKVPAPKVTVVTGSEVKVEAVIASPAEYVFASGAKTTFARADIDALKADLVSVTPTAPTGADAPLIAKDTITLTGATGVMWKVQSGPSTARVTKTYTVADKATAKVPAGENPVVTAEALPIGKTTASDYKVEGTASWDATALKITSTKAEIAAPTAPVVKSDAAGTSKDTITLTGKTGVVWKVGKTADDKAAKSYTPKDGAPQVVPMPAGTSVFAVPANDKEYAFAANAKVAWTASDLGLDQAKGQLTIATAPVGVDLPGVADKITITGAEGVAWKIGKSVVNVKAGATSTVVGRAVEAVPVNALDYEIKGTGSWTTSDLKLTDANVTITFPDASKPVGTNAAGVTKDTVTLNGVEHVSYTVGAKKYTVLAGKTLTVPALPTDTITAVADKGYTLAATSWTGKDTGLLADVTEVEVAEPTFNDNPGKLKDTVTLTPAANIDWYVNNKKVVVAKATDVSTGGVASVTVEAKGRTADYAVKGGTSTWTKTLVVTKGQLEPVAPTADNDAHAVKLTQTAGVIWKIDGVAVRMTSKVTYVPVAATKTKVVVTAVPENPADAEVSKNASTDVTFS